MDGWICENLTLWPHKSMLICFCDISFCNSEAGRYSVIELHLMKVLHRFAQVTIFNSSCRKQGINSVELI